MNRDYVFPHIELVGYARSRPFLSPNKGGSGKFKKPNQDRQAHGEELLRKYRTATGKSDGVKSAAEKAGYTPSGVRVEFMGKPGFDLAVKSLECESLGIELLNTKESKGAITATVFIPHGQTHYFQRKVEAYLDTTRDKPRGKDPTPKGVNLKLVDSVADLRRAVLESFWAEREIALPEPGAAIWWEVWLRGGRDSGGRLNIFRTGATALGLQIGQREVTFPDHTVLLAYGTREQMEESSLVLDMIAELRKAKECPTQYRTALSPREQADWANALVDLTGFKDVANVSICLLDTGVGYAHPLLLRALSVTDCQSCFPEHNNRVTEAHGTEMAGLSLYGDLAEALPRSESVLIPYRLESIQILPPVGVNHPDSYGAITQQAVALSEIEKPNRRRVYSLTISSTDFRDRGHPSSWSAEVDQLCFGRRSELGERSEPERLIIVSAGNTDLGRRADYPNWNLLDEIHDPGQSWNALTVGAFTERTFLNSTDWQGYSVQARVGGLSPSSTTSLTWNKKWPLKPDIVMEGGNGILSPDGKNADVCDELSLLTTTLPNAAGVQFGFAGDTSAATALASRMAATLQCAYPHFWPESVRALMIHSAEWTKTMCELMPARPGKKRDIKLRIKVFGYGVPNLPKALKSATNALNLIAQESITPFHLDPDKKNPTSCEMHLYELPWPTQTLADLGGAEVRMRLTLSYFIEPSPGEKGWNGKFSYASHGLRFDVNKPGDSQEEFVKRINKKARLKDEKLQKSKDERNWCLGSKLRTRGSLHADWWTGTGAQLARCRYIAIYPVLGWWRERSQFNRIGGKVRYALVVSIETESLTADLYTPVANEVRAKVEIPIST